MASAASACRTTRLPGNQRETAETTMESLSGRGSAALPGTRGPAERTEPAGAPGRCSDVGGRGSSRARDVPNAAPALISVVPLAPSRTFLLVHAGRRTASRTPLLITRSISGPTHNQTSARISTASCPRLRPYRHRPRPTRTRPDRQRKPLQPTAPSRSPPTPTSKRPGYITIEATQPSDQQAHQPTLPNVDVPPLQPLSNRGRQQGDPHVSLHTEGKTRRLTKPRTSSTRLEPSVMRKLAHGHPDTAHTQRLCKRCRTPLYSHQPMAVEHCSSRELRGCGRICRPDEGCATTTGDALHVGCAVLQDHGIS